MSGQGFHNMPLLLEPGGGQLGRPLVGAFDRLVGDVLWRTVVDSQPCPTGFQEPQEQVDRHVGAAPPPPSTCATLTSQGLIRQGGTWMLAT